MALHRLPATCPLPTHTPTPPLLLQHYDALCQPEGAPREYFVYRGCCQFCLGMYKEADKSAMQGPELVDDPQNPDMLLKNRLLYNDIDIQFEPPFSARFHQHRHHGAVPRGQRHAAL